MNGEIDWSIVSTIAMPIVMLFLGIWVNRRFENRAALISYLGHVSSFTHRGPDGQVLTINTHSVVLRNAGRHAASNVRLRHQNLADFNIWPQIVYSVEELSGGAREIVIPTLVPGEQITVSYLYFPPMTFERINDGIKCDQGFAQPIPVLLQRQYPAWVNRVAAVLLLSGSVAILYVLFQLTYWLASR